MVSYSSIAGPIGYGRFAGDAAIDAERRLIGLVRAGQVAAAIADVRDFERRLQRQQELDARFHCLDRGRLLIEARALQAVRTESAGFH